MKRLSQQTSFYVVALASLMAVGITTGCNPRPSSTVDSLAANNGIQNSALLLIGSDDGIPGTAKDPPNMQALFQEQGFNFRTTMPGRSLSKNEIYQLSQQASKDLLAQPKGTLFWYFTGHGAENGDLTSSTDDFQFADLFRTMVAARGGVPFHRVIILIDACFAGNTINQLAQANNGLNGTQGMALTSNDEFLAIILGAIVSQLLGLPPMTATTGTVIPTTQIGTTIGTTTTGTTGTVGTPTNTIFGNGSTNPQQLGYEQMLIITASSSRETSGDGNGTGGVGTNAFMSAIRQIKAKGDGTLDQLGQLTRTNAQGQTPQYRIWPPAAANEMVFAVTAAGN